MGIVKIGTIIVTWNQTDRLLACLAALDATGQHHQVWVVDNASQSVIAELLRVPFPDVHVIRLPHNSGFAAGQNVGIEAALAAGVDALFLLNDDAIVEPETLPALVQALADPAIAAVSPKVYFHGTERIIQSVGVRVDLSRASVRMLGSGEPDHGQYDQPTDRDALFGCALLIRSTAWEQVGPFWEGFFNYAEETDWCLRAIAQGWRLCFVPQAVVWHRTSSSLGSDSPLKTYLITRNGLYLRHRNLHSAHTRQGLVYILMLNAWLMLRFLWRGRPEQARAIALGMWDYRQGRTGDCRTPDLALRS